MHSKKNHKLSTPFKAGSPFLLPLVFLLLYLTLFQIYNYSWYIENRFLHFLSADVVGFLYGALILTAPLFLYPLLYFRKVSPASRVVGSLMVLVAWYTKEVIRMTAVYSLGESLFYLLMPMQYGVLLVTVIFISLSETGCRFYCSKRGLLEGPVVTKPPVVTAGLALLLMFPVLYRGGESYFFWFYDLYKLLFI